MSTINFVVSDTDNDLITRIAERAQNFLQLKATSHSKLELLMDITACHANGCELRLNDLLNTDDFNFVHDVCGIVSHLNRRTGKLDNHFVPRFAKQHG
jgi:hypothetical protein